MCRWGCGVGSTDHGKGGGHVAANQQRVADGRRVVRASN